MDTLFTRGALLGTLLMALAACGGSGDGSSSAGGEAPAVPDIRPTTALTRTDNEFTQVFCPTAASESVQGSVDANACQTEANEGIPAANGNVLSRMCPVAADGFAVVDYDGTGVSVLPVAFAPACLQELAGMLGNLDELLGGDGGNPLLGALCPTASLSSEFDPASCLTEALSLGNGDLPGLSQLTELTSQIPVLGDLLGTLFGGDVPGDDFPGLDGLCDPADPLSCLAALAGLLNPLTEALDQIPLLGDVISGLLGGDLPGGGLPGDGFPELDQLAGLLAPLTDLLGDVPVLGDIINGLLGGLLENGAPGELPGLPALPDLGNLCDPEDPLHCLTKLSSLLRPLGEIFEQVPLLGEVLNTVLDNLPLHGGLPGADGLPGLEELSGLLAPLADLTGDIPVLGDVINGLLGDLLNGDATPGEGVPGLDGLCDPADPLSCLATLTDLLAPLTGLLAEVPVLGDVVNGILAGELPGDGLPGGSLPGLGELSSLLAPLAGLVSEIPVLGDVLNQLLAPLLGGDTGGVPDLGGQCDPADPLSCLAALTDLLAPLSDAVAQVPVLGEVVNGLLEALLSGGAPSLPGIPDLQALCGDAADPLACLLSVEQLAPLTGLLTQLPVIGDILDGLLGGLLGGGGGNNGGNNGSPLDDIPVLGPILGPILGGLLG